MMPIQSFKDLIVWQKAMVLVKEVYAVTKNLPQSEMYGLTSQMRRAAVSIPSNIAEGYKRKNLGEYIQFLGIANGSSGELETQLLIMKEVYPVHVVTVALSLNDEVQKMLLSLMRTLSSHR